MKTFNNNELFGNIILCEKCDEKLENLVNPFDRIKTKKNHNAGPFDVVAFLNCFVENDEEVNLLISISSKDGGKIRFLAYRKIFLKANETYTNTSRFRVKNLSFENEGEFCVDLRITKEPVPGDLSGEGIRNQFENSGLICRALTCIGFKEE